MTTPSTSNNKSQLPSALIANLQGVLAGRKDSAAGDGNGHIGEKNECGDEETPVPSSGVGSASSPKGSKPIVLLTNSDGIGSPGLTLLVEALVRDGQCDIYVCAPESDKSSCGHSITSRETLAVTSAEISGAVAYEVSGTSADCVSLALSGALFSWSRPVLVVSGINKGTSCGHQVFYSGSVAGAREAVMSGIPSISVSLIWREESQESDMQDAVDACLPLLYAAIRAAEKGTFLKECLLNIQIPASPSARKGFKVTRQSQQRPVLSWRAVSANRHPHAGQYMSMHQSLGVQLAQLSRDASAAGAARRVTAQRKTVEVESIAAAGKPEQREAVKKYFRMEVLEKEHDDLDEDLDFRAVENGFIAVTPVHVNPPTVLEILTSTSDWLASVLTGDGEVPST